MVAGVGGAKDIDAREEKSGSRDQDPRNVKSVRPAKSVLYLAIWSSLVTT